MTAARYQTLELKERKRNPFVDVQLSACDELHSSVKSEYRV